MKTNIFKRYSYWFKSAKYTSIQKFITLAFGVLSFILLTRLLDLSSFGEWGLFLIIAGICETARTALIKNAFVRFSNQVSTDEQASLQTAAFVLSFIIAFILSLFLFFFANIFSYYLNAPDLTIMLKWFGLSLIVGTLFSHTEIIFTSRLDFRGICWIYCLRQALLFLPVLVYFFFNAKITPVGLSIIYFLSVFISSLVGLWFGRGLLHFSFIKYREWIFKTWSFGKFVLWNNISSLLFRSTDNFITSKYFGTTVAGQYNACLRIGNLIDLPSQVLSDILYPRAAKFSATDKKEIKNIYEKSVGASLVFSIPALITLILNPDIVLALLAGHKFIIAANILRVTAIFGFILPFLKQFGTVMDATGSPKVNFLVMFFAFIINIFANLGGVHIWGPIGAAIGTLFTYFIIFILTQIILFNRFGVSLKKIFSNTFYF